jgi:hypothetical protein
MLNERLHSGLLMIWDSGNRAEQRKVKECVRSDRSIRVGSRVLGANRRQCTSGFRIFVGTTLVGSYIILGITIVPKYLLVSTTLY